MTATVTRPVCYFLFRFLLPITLLAAAIFRFNGLSFLYTIFLLITALLSVPSAVSFRGSTGIYLKILIAFSSLAVLAQATFHIVLGAIATAKEPYGSIFPSCTANETLTRQVGLERLDNVPVVDIIRLILPDVGVFIVSIVVFIISNVLLKRDAAQETSDLPTTVKTPRRRRVSSVIEFFGEFLLTLLLCISGIILPSALSAVYFLTFLVIATLWACYKNLGRKFAGFRVFLLVYTGLHILVLHLYQFQFFQDYLPHTEFLPRLLGLTGIIKTDCASVWRLEFHDDVKWSYFVNPGLLLLLYWVLAFETRRWCHKKNHPEVDSPIVVSRGRKRKKARPGSERQVQQTADQEETGSVVFSGSAYGEPDELDEKLLVDDAEAPGGAYNSMDPTGGDHPDPSASQPTDATDGKTKRDDGEEKRSAYVSIFVYIMKQSYVLTLIAMMAWSITFHSWLTFALLLGACLLWMVPKSRKACLMVSPFIVFYAECLLIMQFIFGMQLVELPERVGDFTYAEIGLMKFKYPCLQLALQVFYTLFFWLTLRQFMRERRAQQEFSPGYPMEPVEGSSKKTAFTDFLNLPIEVDMVDGYDSNTMKMIGNYCWVLLCKYWIFVCTGMLLLISMQDVVIYRIIYMIFFLMFIITFQLSYTLWRVTMFLFWWVVIIYSMFVLIIIYTYQFHQFPNYWHMGTGWDNETLQDIGLEQYDTAGLFIKLLTPTSFLIVVIIQVHYFHTPFLKMSALDRYRSEDSVDVDNAPTDYTTDETGATTTDTEGEFQRRTKRWRRRITFLFFKLWHKASGYWETLSTLLWRLTEIHVFKVVAFIIMLVSVNEVYAISAVYVILICAILPISRCHVLLSHLAQIWTTLVILAKMLYQLKLVKTDYWLSNCTLFGDMSTDIISSTTTVGYNVTNTNMTTIDFGNHSNVPVQNGSIDNALWVGLAKIDKLNVSVAYYIRLFILILLVIAFESIVRYHQRQRYGRPQVEKPKQGIIFPQIKRPDADKNMKSCLQFFANYLFYKFGLELCYIMTAIAICVRVDVYAVLYAIFLGILLLLSRRGNARIWPIYTIVLAVLLPIQFMSCVGMPFVLCFEYPWEHTTDMSRNLEQWLYLPDYANGPHAHKLIADFFQLLFVCLQWRVFRIELSSRMEEYGGGDNHDILPEVEANKEIPVADFTSTRTSYLDVIKYAVFMYMFWVTLAIVFITGLTRVNLFSMGYVIGVFCFMWYGQEFLLKPLRKLRKMWSILIAYTFLVLFIKACLQLVGCVYIKHLYKNQCWLIQLLGIDCLSSTIDVPPSSCVVEPDDTGLTWDVICFTFLLLQARIYSSHYFRHIVDELEAQNRLASRGAELINRINIREVIRQKEKEKEILKSIKKKMSALQTKQAKLKKNYVEPDDHYTAIRSGDYYLFEDDFDEEGEETADTLTFGTDTDTDKEKKLGPLQIISTAVDSGTDAAVEKAKSTETLEKEADGSPKAETSTATPGDDDQQPGDVELPAESKVRRILVFIGTFLASIVDWFIRLFNTISRNYRIVAQQLEKEKKREKEKIQEEKRNMIAKQHVESSEDEEKGDAGASDLMEVTIAPKESKGTSQAGSTFTLDELDQEEEEKLFEKSHPRLYRLLVATYYMLVSRSELLCYLLMILNQMIYCSLLSLPLPLMVFLWGMLSLPRPSKTFWITAITYVEAIVVTKYMFQFSFFPWNDESIHESPFWPPRIIGIEKNNNYASADLVLLLAMFIHRSILKRYGLWRDDADISADMAKAEMKELSPPCSPQPDIDETEADAKPKALEEADVDSLAVTTGSSHGELVEEKPPSKIKVGLKKCVKPFQEFFFQVTQSSYSATVDVYAPMFGCDFIVFLIVVFGYWAFGPAATSGSGDVTSYIQENRIPVPFLIMLIAQFALIIIDRALFLRKNVLGKFIFQIFLVIVAHVWMFFVLPAVTGRSFNDNVPAMLWYFIKCVYFGLSAYQIRCGYPTRILGNFLTKKYNYLNLILFKGFLAIPFLLELRALMDWIWTDTTLALGSWLQMEDIYANIFVLKCFRRAEATYPTPRAMRRKTIIKYGVGGLLLLVIIFIIWFPLVLFSFANTVFQKNAPFEASITITVGGYQPLFKMTAQQESIHELTGVEYNKLKNHYNKDVRSVGFISNYDAEDITRITFNGNSTSLWGISPPSQQKLIKDLNSNLRLPMEFLVAFKREPTAGQSESISNEFVIHLSSNTQKELAKIIGGNRSDHVNITALFPRFIRLGLAGRAQDVIPLLHGPYGIGYSNLSMNLDRSKQPFIEWWRMQEIVEGSILVPDRSKPPHFEDHLTVITFNDRKAPAGFSVITGYGIIGLYLSFILLIGRILRLSTTGQYLTIMFIQMPDVDRVLRLCLDIYLVREMKEFALEEDLYAKLQFFYRSPETIIKWTRKKNN